MFSRLKTLFTAARVNAYTQLALPAKTEDAVEPIRRTIHPQFTHGMDDWLFSAEKCLSRRTDELATEMDGLSSALTGLRATLDLISGATPFPIASTTLRPCAIALPDHDLFEGEILPQPIIQHVAADENSPILFEDISGTFERTDQARHAA